MNTSALRTALAAAFGDDNAGVDVRLAPFTTFKVGGPADLFVEPKNSEALLTSIRLAAQSRFRNLKPGTDLPPLHA